MWVWLAVGGVLGAISLLVGLGFAAVLGMIGREVSVLQEDEAWLSRPMTREAEAETGNPYSRRHRDTQPFA
jgi:hypothetical protein